jgi:hypothetical protein
MSHVIVLSHPPEKQRKSRAADNFPDIWGGRRTLWELTALEKRIAALSAQPPGTGAQDENRHLFLRFACPLAATVNCHRQLTRHCHRELTRPVIMFAAS